MKLIREHAGIVMVLVVAFIAHSTVALIPPLNGDEATFWEWSRHLALGYYDHPPLTAWLVALATNLFGIYKYTVRLPAILLHLATIVLIYRLSWEILATKRSAVFAAMLYAVLPISLVMGTAMTTDAALIFFFAAAVYCSKKAVIDQQPHHWYWVGLSCGGMLLTKFMAVLFFPGLFLFLLINRTYRWVFLIKEPYLAAMIASVLFSPFLYWNAQHKWLTFQFNLVVRNRKEGFNPIKPLEYIAGQLFAGSPLVFGVLVVAVVIVLLRWHRHSLVAEHQTEEKEAALSLLAYFTAFPILFFAVLSLSVEVAPHWPAVIYAPGVVVLVAWLQEKRLIGQSKLYWSGFATALVITAALSFLVLFPKVLPDKMIYTEKVNDEAPIVSHYFGWHEIGAHIDRIKQEWEDRPEGFFLTAKDYSLASMLGFYTPSHPTFYLMNVTEAVVHGKDYLLWGKGKKPLGANSIYVGDTPDSYQSRLPAFFKETRQLEPLIIRDHQGRILRIFYITLGIHYLGGEPDHLSLW